MPWKIVLEVALSVVGVVSELRALFVAGVLGAASASTSAHELVLRHCHLLKALHDEGRAVVDCGNRGAFSPARQAPRTRRVSLKKM